MWGELCDAAKSAARRAAIPDAVRLVHTGVLAASAGELRVVGVLIAAFGPAAVLAGVAGRREEMARGAAKG